jgi:hypothetical protein
MKTMVIEMKTKAKIKKINPSVLPFLVLFFG